MNDEPLNSTNSFGELLPGTPLPRVEQAAVPADLALIDAQGQLRFTAAGESSLRQFSGCDSSPLGLRFLRQAVNAAGGAQSHDRLQQTAEAGAFLHSIRPADAIEGALAAQLYAMHVAGMHNMAQAASATDEGCADLYRNRARKLFRSFAQQMAALKCHRGRGHQTVRVEHVQVHAGGEVVVGTLNARGQ